MNKAGKAIGGSSTIAGTFMGGWAGVQSRVRGVPPEGGGEGRVPMLSFAGKAECREGGRVDHFSLYIYMP